jgi:hypothetical protein
MMDIPALLLLLVVVLLGGAGQPGPVTCSVAMLVPCA